LHHSSSPKGGKRPDYGAIGPNDVGKKSLQLENQDLKNQLESLCVDESELDDEIDVDDLH
jgi:hypothetical protein